MIGRDVSKGNSGVGLYAYLAHDRQEKAGPKARTADRVDWIETVESPTEDPYLTLRIMQGVVSNRLILRARADGSPGGRKLKNSYQHFMCAWAPGEHPTRDEQRDAVKSMLRALGLDKQLAIIVAHSDTDHPHVHVIVCKISRETGLAASVKNSKLKLSKWSLDWELNHGGIRIKTRLDRACERDRFNKQIAWEMRYYTLSGTTKRARATAHATKRREVVKEIRASPSSANYRLTPMQHDRGAGQDEHTPEETRRWNELLRMDPEYQAMKPKDRANARKRLAAELSPAVDETPALTGPAVTTPATAATPTAAERFIRAWRVREAAARMQPAMPRSATARMDITDERLTRLADDLRTTPDDVDVLAADAVDVIRDEASADSETRAREQAGRPRAQIRRVVDKIRDLARQVCTVLLREVPAQPISPPQRPARATDIAVDGGLKRGGQEL